MGPLELINHLVNLLAPALVLGPFVDLAARAGLVPGSRRRRWWLQWLLNIAAGAAVLVAGFILTGQDGKMITYLALILVIATVQWLSGRGWRAS